MKPAYRGQGFLVGCMPFGILMLGVIGQLVLMYFLFPYQKQLQAWVLAIAAIPFLIAVTVLILANKVMQKKRLTSIAEALAPLGITVFAEPSQELRAELSPHVEGLKGPYQLSGGVANVTWLAYNDQLFLFEHSYTTGSGKSTVEHVRTVVAWPRGTYSRVDMLCDLPWMIAARAGYVEARALKADLGEDQEIGEPTFDGKWSIFGHPDTAMALFTPFAREQLNAARKGERWSIGGGWVACGTPMAMNAANVAKFVAHAEAVVGIRG